MKNFKLKEDIALHDIFLISIIIKGIDGFLELIGGIWLSITSSTLITNSVQKFFQEELIEDPTDIIANFLIKISQNISSNTLSFISIYLIIHGAIKLLLVGALLKKKLWAYPLTGIVLAIFVIYQIMRLFNYFSILLLLLTLIDITIIILLRREYLRLKKEIKK